MELIIHSISTEVYSCDCLLVYNVLLRCMLRSRYMTVLVHSQMLTQQCTATNKTVEQEWQRLCRVHMSIPQSGHWLDGLTLGGAAYDPGDNGGRNGSC